MHIRMSRMCIWQVKHEVGERGTPLYIHIYIYIIQRLKKGRWIPRSCTSVLVTRGCLLVLAKYWC